MLLTIPMNKRSKPRLAAEITIILAIKFCLLWLIWLQWFSHPVALHMKVDDSQIQQHFFSAPVSTASSRTLP